MLNGMDTEAEGMLQRARVNKSGDPVVLFDGWCPLCVGAVRFVLRADRRARFSFASLDSPAAKELLDTCEAEPAVLESARAGSTVALVRRGKLYVRSDAALRIVGDLPLPWRAMRLLRVVPRFLRDGVYSAVASRRHELWGRLDSCHVPEPADRGRFL
ncbi:MAG: DCC1-like thiol-disulfide oxidoreductase family protein [Gemmatimonadota bacterium]